MSTPDLSCAELVELVTEFLEGGLAQSERTRFEMHLVRCVPCVTYVAQMEQTLNVLELLGEDDLGEPARPALLAAFRDWKRAEELG